MLSAQTLPWNPICERLAVLIARLTEVTHEEGGVRLEALLRLAPQIPHQPLRVEDILRWHPISHDRVEEALPLASIEAKHLNVAANPGQEGRQRPIAIPLPLASNVSSAPAVRTFGIILLVKVIVLLVVVAGQAEVGAVVGDILLPAAVLPRPC